MKVLLSLHCLNFALGFLASFFASESEEKVKEDEGSKRVWLRLLLRKTGPDSFIAFSVEKEGNPCHDLPSSFLTDFT